MSSTITDIIGALCALRMAQVQLDYIKKQLGIARNFFNIYSEQRAFYRAVFQSGNSGTYQTFSGSNLVNRPPITGPGLERYYLNQVYGAVAPVKNYAAQRTRAGTMLSRLRGLTDGSALRRRAEKYGLPTAQFGLQELSYYQAEASVDLTNYFYRAEEHQFDVNNNRYFERRKNSLSYAVKRGNQISANLGTGYEIMNRSRDLAASDMADGFNNTVQMLGFMSGSRKTEAYLNSKILPIVSLAQGAEVSKSLEKYNSARVSERLDADMAAMGVR